jgi:hypothetical protein
MRFSYLLLCVFLTVGCDKKKEPASSSKASDKTVVRATSQAQASTATPPKEPETGSTETAKAEEAKKVYGEPRDLNREYDRDTLEKAYIEIDCARLKSDPTAMEAIFHKYGFNHPKLWTAAWAKASKDKEWVAKIVMAAQKACPRPASKDSKPASDAPSKPAAGTP